MRLIRLATPGVLFLLLLLPLHRATLHAQAIPDRLSDAEFWRLYTGMSEPNGYFPSENMVSNEVGFEQVIPELTRTVHRGGVYLGVGPEQNFTYIAALRPAMVFIVDIRHQNAMQHLIYKALFELDSNRADFVAALFSRPRPAMLSDTSSVDSLFAAFSRVAPDSGLHARTLAAIRDVLLTRHHFALSADELALVTHNFDAMFQSGPDLNYNTGTSNGGFNGRRSMPTYANLMILTDNAGVERSYLASEANYQALRDLEGRNLLIPLTGDFSGPTAIRAVGQYVRAHHATVTTFYTSNVEQYLFRDNKWLAFEENVASLPLDSTSLFIRSSGAGGFGGGGGGGGVRGPGGAGMRQSLLQSIQVLVQATTDNKIQTYQDVLGTSH
jgi:hypothetical protein